MAVNLLNMVKEMETPSEQIKPTNTNNTNKTITYSEATKAGKKTKETSQTRKSRALFLENIGSDTTMAQVQAALEHKFSKPITVIVQAMGFDTRYKRTGSIDILFTDPAYKTKVLQSGIKIAGIQH